MKKMTLLAPLAVLALAGCSQMSTDVDEVGLQYENGVISNVSFDHCIDPGQRSWDGPGDDHYKYPAGQRTYDFGTGEKQDGGALALIAAGSGEQGANTQVQLAQVGTLTFELNTDCDVLRAFHENIGRKYGAGKDGLQNWSGFMETYLRGPLQRSLTEAAQGVDWKTIYADAKVRKDIEGRVNELLPGYVNQLAGGDYFTGFAVSLSTPTLPDELANALQQTQVAIEQNTAQQQRNVQVQSELDSIRQLVEVLGPDGYNTYQAIKDGKVTVIPVPQGTALNVNPGAPS